jgi:hypothetical protein
VSDVAWENQYLALSLFQHSCKKIQIPIKILYLEEFVNTFWNMQLSFSENYS